MKVLFVGTLQSPLNGSARSFVRLANGMAVMHHVEVAISDKTGITDWLNNSVKKSFVDILPLRRSFTAFLNVTISAWRFYRLLKRSEPDVVHINDVPWFYLIPVSRLLKVPVTIHSRFHEKNKLISYLIKILLERADKVIFVSEYNRNLWSLSSRNQITLHNPGVFELKIKDMNLPSGPYALIVSRISNDKGIIESIRLFSKIKKIQPNLKLLIAGGTQYEYQDRYKILCEKEVTKLGLQDSVHWLGEVLYPHVLYKNASVYLHLPNFDDPFPTTVMEALALNCKIITHSRGGIPEQISGFDGCLLLDEPHKPDALEAFLNQDQIIDRSPEYRRRFDESTFYSRFTELLETVTQKNK